MYVPGVVLPLCTMYTYADVDSYIASDLCDCTY